MQKISSHFEWSLLKGKEYARKRENFWQLCRKCHFKYDLKETQKIKFDEGRLKSYLSNRGKIRSLETRNRIKESLKRVFPEGRIVWNAGKSWSDEVKKKMSLARLGKVPWNKGLKMTKSNV